MPRIPVDCPNKIICIQYDLAHFFEKYSVTITSIHLSILFSVSHRFPNKNIHGGHLCQAKSSSSSASSASRAEQSTRQWLPAMHAMQWAAASAASASAAGAWVEPVSPPFHLKSGGWTNREIGRERENNHWFLLRQDMVIEPAKSQKVGIIVKGMNRLEDSRIIPVIHTATFPICAGRLPSVLSLFVASSNDRTVICFCNKP